MSTGKANLPASVAARLLNRAKQTGDDYQTLLTSFCFERFLYRLGTSDALRADIQMICDAPAEPDAVAFDAGAAEIEAIRAEDEYAGTRVTLPARSGKARLSLQIDMGLGDSVWPTPRSLTYPGLLDFPQPQVLAYPREAVVAEKLEAVVALGDRNSRIKDFFDLHHLASRFEFDRVTLAEAVRRTFARRKTLIPTEPPIGLTLAYWENPSRPTQVRAFARRAGLAAPPSNRWPEFNELLAGFLLPLLDDLRSEARSEGTWLAGGPWR